MSVIPAISRPKITNARLILSALILISFSLVVYRFFVGLGEVTNMSDSVPWGLWKGFHVLVGIALAAGGFVLAGVVHVFGLRKFEVFTRPAVTTAFMGYLFAVLGLIIELGRPWTIWHPIVFWQPHSLLFEVSWCVMLYNCVLFLEFLPIVCERFQLKTPLKVLRKVMIFFVGAGVLISSLHQSSLGSLFVLAGHRLHELWFSPILPLFFITSAVAVGISMVIFEAILAGLIFGRQIPTRVMGDLAKALPPILFLYLGLKLMDLNANNELGLLLENSMESWVFIIELVVGVLVPGILLLGRRFRYSRLWLFFCTMMVVAGVVMNRLNICLLAIMRTASEVYIPTWIEIMVSVGVVCGGLLLLSIANQNLPIDSSRRAEAQAETS
jgi:Ni/Fe-hydrogenase subunit HybB-like protein